MQHQIAIGPEFFAKAPGDYSDRFWAWAREIIQNSQDAPGCSKITIDVTYQPGVGTIGSVINNGAPMTEDILVNKLLALGSSGKTGDGTSVGGFGKAKEILYFCHESYAIHSGGCQIVGRGAGYDLLKTPFVINGTRSDIVWMGGNDVSARLIHAFRKMIERVQWWGSFVLNGEEIRGNLWKGKRRREFEWGVVYTTGNLSNEAVIRINGMPMFTRYTQIKQGVVVELTGNSLDRLTSNRDNLKHPFSGELDNFITSLSVDTKSALRAVEPTYTHIKGDKIRHMSQDRLIPHEISLIANGGLQAVASAIIAHEPLVRGGQSEFNTVSVEVPAKPGRLAFDFLLKNTTQRDIPRSFDPNSSKFSKHSSRLVTWWASCLLALHEVANHESEFAVGFIFDEDRGAEYDKGEYGKVYLINPCKVSVGAWKARYTTAKEKHAVLALAAHEFVHGLGFSYHNEDYSSKLTEVMGLVLANGKKFVKCFKTPKKTK